MVSRKKFSMKYLAGMSNFVVDTNLLVSAAIIKNTLPFRGIEKIIREGHSLVFSTETFREIETVL